MLTIDVGQRLTPLNYGIINMVTGNVVQGILSEKAHQVYHVMYRSSWKRYIKLSNISHFQKPSLLHKNFSILLKVFHN